MDGNGLSLLHNSRHFECRGSRLNKAIDSYRKKAWHAHTHYILHIYTREQAKPAFKGNTCTLYHQIIFYFLFRFFWSWVHVIRLSYIPNWRLASFKVHIFWEGHKILQNLHLTFDYSTYSQKLDENFAKFCGLLRIHELYLSKRNDGNFQILPRT